MWLLKRNGSVTLGLFFVLASVMFFTRNVDGYALGERESIERAGKRPVSGCFDQLQVGVGKTSEPTREMGS